MRTRIHRGSISIALLAAIPAFAADVSWKLPPVRSVLNVAGEPVGITISGTISGSGKDAFALRLVADLAEVQQNMTEILRAELNRSEKCGERIEIQKAVLMPEPPSSLLTTNLHFEKWLCTKLLGKEVTKRLLGGDGVLKLRLTPRVEEKREVRFDADIVSIDADGALGEALRSDSLGPALRDKLRNALLVAMAKNLKLNAALPPELEAVATIDSVKFIEGGERHLSVELNGQVKISAERLRSLIH